MARLFPFRSEPSTEEGQPRVVDLEGEDADAVFSALSSTTARRIYARLDDEPGTPSDVADAIDSSIQNVRYHLEKLQDAGLVEIVDTWYSSRGNEMSVYATTDGPLIVTSDESKAAQLKTALSRLIGGIGALAGGSLLVQYGLTRWFAPSGGGFAPGATDDEAAGDAGDEERYDAADEETSGRDGAEDDDAGDAATGDDAAEDAPESEGGDDFAIAEDTDEADEEANGAETTGEEPSGTEDAGDGADGVAGSENGSDPNATDGGFEGAENATDAGVEAAEAVFATVPPGLLFFLGGLVVLLAVTAYWYWHRPAY